MPMALRRGSFAEAVSSRGPAPSKVSVATQVSFSDHGKPLQSSTPRLKLALPGHSISAAKAADPTSRTKDIGAAAATEVTPSSLPPGPSPQATERVSRSSSPGRTSPSRRQHVPRATDDTGGTASQPSTSTAAPSGQCRGRGLPLRSVDNSKASEIETSHQSSALLALNCVSDYKVTVTPHKTLNTIQGVISEDDLLDASESEVVEGLSEQGVVAARRISLRRDGQELKTRHIVLTFESTTLPESVKAGYLYCRDQYRDFTSFYTDGPAGGTCESRCLESGVSTDPEPRRGRLHLGARCLARTYSDAVRQGPPPRTESKATQVLPEALAVALRAPTPLQGQQLSPPSGGSTLAALKPKDRQATPLPVLTSTLSPGEKERHSHPKSLERASSKEQHNSRAAPQYPRGRSRQS
ncbi:hypothetical protein ISCGN_002382 [Ixodes scapularis]